jgi:GNAT superfamily N-acetyltransferase
VRDTLQIRQVTPDDLAEWTVLWSGYNAFYGREGATALPAEAARGQGVGRALVDAVYERARAAGAERVYWHTHETNTRAMRLYDEVAERTGFLVYRKLL